VRSRFFVEPEAEGELREAVDWYEARARGLGKEFLRAVRAVFALIERNPEQFPCVQGEIRRGLVRRFPYAVYYVLDTDQISVIACIHTRRHPRRWQSRR
jgi:plasmid stabilization system protein ParE